VTACIERQAFDSDAFGIPFHRVVRFDPDGVVGETKRLEAAGPHVIDAKLPAEDLENAFLLQRAGFRRICTQFELVHDLEEPLSRAIGIEFSDRLELPDELLWEHARNFVYDRFSMDPLLPPEGGRTLYRRWIGNSLTGRRRVVHDGRNFCTYAEGDGRVSIDLVSVLDGGRGIGSRLMAALVGLARERGAGSIVVVTECENRPAWSLYLKCGFRVSRFMSVFHKVGLG